MAELSIDQLVQRLSSEHPEDRIDACRQIAKQPHAARLAVPRLIELLDDREAEFRRVGPDFDGEYKESWSYVASSAVHALSKVAPDAAVDRVAKTIVRLEGMIKRREAVNSSGTFPIERCVHWTREELVPFGPALVDALRRIVAGSTGDERTRAEAVLGAAEG
jgi:hypothetical protein